VNNAKEPEFGPSFSFRPGEGPSWWPERGPHCPALGAFGRFGARPPESRTPPFGRKFRFISTGAPETGAAPPRVPVLFSPPHGVPPPSGPRSNAPRFPNPPGAPPPLKKIRKGGRWEVRAPPPEKPGKTAARGPPGLVNKQSVPEAPPLSLVAPKKWGTPPPPPRKRASRAGPNK